MKILLKGNNSYIVLSRRQIGNIYITYEPRVYSILYSSGKGILSSFLLINFLNLKVNKATVSI